MDKTNQLLVNSGSSILARIRNEDWPPEISEFGLSKNRNQKQEFYLILARWTFCGCNCEFVHCFFRALEPCNYLVITKVPQTQTDITMVSIFTLVSIGINHPFARCLRLPMKAFNMRKFEWKIHMFSHLMCVCTQFQQALEVAPDQRNSVKL